MPGARVEEDLALGVLGLEQTPITFSRVAGVALLLAGTFLIIR